MLCRAEGFDDVLAKVKEFTKEIGTVRNDGYKKLHIYGKALDLENMILSSGKPFSVGLFRTKIEEVMAPFFQVALPPRLLTNFFPQMASIVYHASFELLRNLSSSPSGNPSLALRVWH